MTEDEIKDKEKARREAVRSARAHLVECVRSEDPDPFSLFSQAQKLQEEGLRWLTEEFVGALDVGPLSDKDTQEFRTKFSDAVSAMAASNRLMHSGLNS